jgi:transglutaminase-like putative cysteine protease
MSAQPAAAAVAPREVAAPLIAVAVLSGVVALGFSVVFAGNGYLLPLLGAAVAPGALAAALLAWRVPTVLRVPLGLAAIVLYLTLAIAPGVAILNGWMRLLTAALPLDPRGPVLGAVAAVVALVSLLGSELALRSRRPLVATLPAVVGFTAALAVGASGRRLPWWPPALLVAIGGALLIVAAAGRHTGQPTASGPMLAGAVASRSRPRALRRLLPAVTIVAAAAVLASHGGPLLPGATARAARFDARDLVAEPVTPRASVSPLVRFPVLRGSKRTLFVVHGDRPVARLRVVTLSNFDGQLWSSTAVYRRAGHHLPPGPERQVPLEQVRLSVEIEDAGEALWLPTGDRAVEVSIADLGVDGDTGDLIVPDDRPVPARYQVTSVLPRPTTADLRAAAAATSQAPLAPQAPPDLETAARSAAGGATTSFGRLANLESFFRSRGGGFTYDDSRAALSGHGLFQVRRLLALRSGTAEQYASAFAVMARILGYDTRVVMGFRRSNPGNADEDEAWRVTGRDIHAWPEVRFEQLGWVPFEPSPSQHSTGGRKAAPTTPTERAVQQAIEQEVAQQQKGGPSRDQPPPPQSPRRRGIWPSLLLGFAAVLGLLLAAIALAVPLLPLAKTARRHRRRRAADPTVRVVGAWREALDRLSEHSVPTTPTMTSAEVVSAGASRLGSDRADGLRRLADQVDAARFALELVDDHHATTAWRTCDRLRHTLHADDPPQRRLLHAVDPRPLLRRPTRLP